MTLEELTYTIKEALRVSTDYDPYAEGYQDAICWVYDLLDQLEPSWHPYPREEPPKGGELYWVTLDEGDGQRKVLDDLFLNGEFVNYNECSIVAWAEYNRPNPYEGEAYEH